MKEMLDGDDSLWVVTYSKAPVNTGIYKTLRRAVSCILDIGVEHVTKVERLRRYSTGAPEDWTELTRQYCKEEETT